MVLQNIQQWAGGGDKSDEVCEEAKQEVVSQAREHDYQQLGELVPEMPKCQKNGSCFLAFFLLIVETAPGVGPASKPGAENETYPTDGAGRLQHVTLKNNMICMNSLSKSE